MGSKNKRKKNSKDDSVSSSSKIITDSRFSSVHSDPRFQNVPKKKSKVAIDPRFNRMFTDTSFRSSTAPLDKRGKAKKNVKTSKSSHYYQIEDEEKQRDEDNETEEEERRIETDTESEIESEQEAAEVASESETDDEVGGDVEESTTDEEVGDADFEGSEVEEEAVPEIEKETHRLAVVNMDWRHVKAVDLYVILSSFIPKDGQILSVAVYPSEFGIQRMKEEEIHGPVGLFDDQNDNSDDEDNNEIDEEKLRAYERSRLRYYYAVVECDCSTTADYLYKACDGIEFERSSNKLDLRFIPDTMELKHPPRDVATEVPANYGGLDFFTKALQHSNVQLSWDDDEPDRVKTLKRKFNADQLAELELKEFLASDEDETDNEDDSISEEQSDKKSKKRDKYRALLESGDGSDEDDVEGGQDMEVTFNTGLEDISKRILEKKDKTSETVWEAYLRRRREKKKAKKSKSNYSSDDESNDTDREAIEEPDDFFVEEPKVKQGKEARGKRGKEDKEQQDTEEANASRAELELLLADDKGADNGLKGYNLKPKKAKGKKGKEVPDEDKIPTADYDDPRFSDLFTSALFALDPTDPQFKRSAAYARQIAQKKQKGDSQEPVIRERTNLTTNAQIPDDDHLTNTNMKSDVSSLNRDKHELSSLVRSLKMKSKHIQPSSDGKLSKKGRGVQSIPKKGDRIQSKVEENNAVPDLVQSSERKTKKLKK